MKVHHVRDQDFTVYIGRPSVYGNPFIIGRDGTRKQCIRKFEKYARKNERIMKAIGALKKNAILGCHCKPKACHGDVIVAIHKELRKDATVSKAADVPRVPSKSGTRADLHRVSRIVQRNAE
jgi:uncharacterized protein DUF4326